MTVHRAALLNCLFILAAAFRTGAGTAAYGPFNGYFIPDGVGLKKPLPPEAGLLKADGRWLIYCWVKGDGPAGAWTLLAGFGDPSGEAGSQRYLTARAGNVSFRAGNTEVTTGAPLRPGAWQFLAATFDGASLRLYVDGVEAASSEVKFTADATPVIHLAPGPPPQSGAEHFAGKIAGLTLVPVALTRDEIRSLMAWAKNLDQMPFEAGSKTWPVQVKGQSGLRAPQEAWTLPRPPAEFSKPQARPVENAGPVLDPRGANE